jgi:hypothetical protein
MKKEILIVLMLIGIIGNVTAICNLNIESGLDIVGIGVIDRDLDAQTKQGYEGLHLSETMYSSSKTIDKPSNIDFSSNLNIYIGPDYTKKDVNITEIEYRQTALITNIYHRFSSQNYDVGTATGFKTIARKSANIFEVEMTPNNNYLELKETIQGKTRLKHIVVDQPSKLKIINDVTQLEGTFQTNWFTSTRKLIENDDDDHWLGGP